MSIASEVAEEQEYARIKKYVDRLVEEWKKHGKIVIACDYDSTISYWPTINNQHDMERTIKLLKDAYLTGAHIVIFSACNPDRYDEIEKYCAQMGITIAGINKTIIDIPYGQNGKIYANIYLDDRACLPHSLDILEYAMYKIRGERQTDILTKQEAAE